MHIPSNSPLKEVPADYSPGEKYNRWFKIPSGLDKGKSMYYYDYTTNSNPQKTVLFVHGNPECSYTYRHIRDTIIASKEAVQIIAMDHIGFGISDQATFEMVDMHHAANLKLFLDFLDLTNILLVIHDWGGPIGIGALIDSPQRVAGIVLMNTTVFPMPKEGYTYSNFPFKILPWVLSPRLIPDGLWGGLAAYVVSNAHPQGFFTFLGNTLIRVGRHLFHSFDKKNPEYVWSQMLRSKMNARSSKRQVRQTGVWGYGYEYKDKKIGVVSNVSFYQYIQATISKKWGDEGTNIPVAGFFGMWDASGKKEVIQQWINALPRIQENLYQYENVGHFIEEYKGVEIGQTLIRFLSEKQEKA